MLVLSLKVELLEPLFPFVCIVVAVQLQFMPFHTAIFDINMAIVLIFLELTAKLLKRLHDRFSFLGIMDVLGFPLRQLIANDFIRNRKCRKQCDGQRK